jgi:hypothetical protein
MQRTGNDQEGFSLEFDVTSGTLLVTAWGFWSAAVAVAFGDAVVDTPMRGVRRIAFDMTRLKPMREEGQAAWSKVMSELSKIGAVAKISVTTASQLTKLQLLRIAREAAGKNMDKLEWVEPVLAR